MTEAQLNNLSTSFLSELNFSVTDAYIVFHLGRELALRWLLCCWVESGPLAAGEVAQV